MDEDNYTDDEDTDSDINTIYDIAISMEENNNMNYFNTGVKKTEPIAIKNKMILFPIQEDSELEIFQRLFKEIIDHIELKIEEEIFLPHTSADVHEH